LQFSATKIKPKVSKKATGRLEIRSMLLPEGVIKQIYTSSAKYLHIWREQKTEEYLGNYFPLIVSAILRKRREQTLKKEATTTKHRRQRADRQEKFMKKKVNGTETRQ